MRGHTIDRKTMLMCCCRMLSSRVCSADQAVGLLPRLRRS